MRKRYISVMLEVSEDRLKGVAMDTLTALPPTHSPRSQRLLQLIALAGAGLVVAAGLVLLAGQWDTFTLGTRLLISGAGALVLAVAAGVVAARPPGALAMRATDGHSEHEARRIITAVLLVGTAVLTCFTVLQPATATEMGGLGWWPSAALASGLAISLIAAWLTPGVLATVATWLFTAAWLRLTLEAMIWNANDVDPGLRTEVWATGAWVALGMVLSLAAYRWLRPSVLAVALGVGTWFFAGLQGALNAEQYAGAPLEVPEAVLAAARDATLLGEVSLGLLLVVGVVQFLRTQNPQWPWPAGAVASLVVLSLVLTAHTLGVAASLLVTGVALVIAAGGLAYVLARRARSAPLAVPEGPSPPDLPAG